VKLPEVVATTPLRAWSLGLAAAVALEWVAIRTPFGLFALAVPLVVVLLVVYALTVRPRLFAASGVLLGTLPLLTWGIFDGLMKCVGFNANGGSCQADPSAQVTIAIGAYVMTVIVTAMALRRAFDATTP
jgi:hypothetical protein